MPVPLLDIARQHAPILSELKAVLDEALKSSRFIKGPSLDGFEQEFAAYCESPHAIGCASGTDALMLALQACSVGPGDEVITVPFTFFATAGAIARCGARPAFVDILTDTFNISTAALRGWLEANCEKASSGAVRKGTGKAVRAVIPVDLFGQIADMDGLEAVAKDWGLALIEDACQSVGATWRTRKAGSFGVAGCFSFFPSKNLGALGDGGAITVSDPALAERLIRLREHGGQGYIHREVGTNSRMDALQAGFLSVKLRHLDGWHEGRRRNAAFYEKAFADVPEVVTPVIDGSAVSIYNQYTIRARNRDGLLAWLKERGIGCAIYYPLPLHMQECFSSLGYREGDFPVAEKASRDVLSLPVFAELAPRELDEVVAAVKGFYASRNTG